MAVCIDRGIMHRMPRSKSDIANAALRIFLQEVGRFYDKARGYEEYRSNKTQKRTLLEFFGNACCYCGLGLSIETMSEDHLVPMNKDALGLHAWGNVVPSCAPCNKAKHFGKWRDHVAAVSSSSDVASDRAARISDFLDRYRYEPNLRLQSIANNLYEDVGAVAMTLIGLRFRQAEEIIRELTPESSS